MKKLLSLSALATLSLMTAACTSPDKCIDELDCGVGAYSEERTYREYDSTAMKTSPAKEPVMMEETVVVEEPVMMEQPTPPAEPVKGSAEPMFDDRLTK